MRTKIIAALLAVLTALGGLNLFRSIKERLLPSATAQSSAVYESRADATEGKSKVRVRVRASESEMASDRVVERSVVRVREASKVMIDERFKVRAGQILVVDVEHADVTVFTDDINEARIVVTLDSNKMDRAEEIFEEMEFTVEMVGDEVRVESQRRKSDWSFNWNGRFEVNVDVTIPDRFDVEMKTTHGDVELDDLLGRVILDTTHGDVSVDTIEGSEIVLKSTHGDIEGDMLTGDRITLSTTHADIDVEHVISRLFEATTTHSDVVIETVEGDSEISTSHGDIEISITEGYDAELTTSHGDVLLYAPSSMKADLDLKGASVSVSPGFGVQGDSKKDEVKGLVNGGGARIVARTTYGSVSLKKK